jgi:hypothetical protein
MDPYYPKIREAYKHFAGVNPAGIIPSIGQNVFTEIISNCPGLLDSKNMKLADLDIEFTSTNASSDKSKQNPDRQLVRFQFLEIFIRLALQKYYKTNICPNPIEAIKKLMKTHVLPFLN